MTKKDESKNLLEIQADLKKLNENLLFLKKKVKSIFFAIRRGKKR